MAILSTEHTPTSSALSCRIHRHYLRPASMMGRLRQYTPTRPDPLPRPRCSIYMMAMHLWHPRPIFRRHLLRSWPLLQPPLRLGPPSCREQEACGLGCADPLSPRRSPTARCTLCCLQTRALALRASRVVQVLCGLCAAQEILLPHSPQSTHWSGPQTCRWKTSTAMSSVTRPCLSAQQQAQPKG